MKCGSRLVALGLFILILGSLGCARQPGMLAPTASHFISGGQELPFDRQPDSRGISPIASLGIDEIPAGTLLPIRLKSKISSATARIGEPFSAVLAEALQVDGQTIAPNGALLTGTVWAAKAGGGSKDPGYLRLSLSTITISGKPCPLETSGVFVNGRNHFVRSNPSSIVSDAGSDGSEGDVELSAGRLLTFRLTQSSSQD